MSLSREPPLYLFRNRLGLHLGQQRPSLREGQAQLGKTAVAALGSAAERICSKKLPSDVNARTLTNVAVVFFQPPPSLSPSLVTQEAKEGPVGVVLARYAQGGHRFIG